MFEHYSQMLIQTKKKRKKENHNMRENNNNLRHCPQWTTKYK